MLERVQHRFTRLFPKLRVMTYEAQLKALKLWSLEERRNTNRADLIDKLMHPSANIINILPDCYTDSCTRGHTKKLVKSHCRTNARLCIFSLRVINRFYSLSQEIVDAVAPSVNAFKRHLQSL